MFGLRTQSNNTQQATLYVIVFGSAYVRFVAILLFAFFLLNPVFRAEAEEMTDETKLAEQPEEKVIAEVEELEPEVVEEVVAEPEDKQVDDESETVQEPDEMEENVSNFTETGAGENEQSENEAGNEDEVSEDGNGITETEEVPTTDSAATSEETDYEDDAIDGGQVSEDGSDVVEAEESSTSDSATTSEETNYQVGEDEATTSTIATDEEEVIELISTSTIATTTDSNSETGSDNLNGAGGINNDDEENNETASTAESGIDEEVSDSVQTDSDEGDLSDSTDSGDQANYEDDTATTTDNVFKPTSTSTDNLASSSLDVATHTPAVVFETSPDEFDFSEKECRAVGDSSYYCVEADNAIDDALEDAVFAAPDADGDMEIYVRLDGKQSKLTDNLVDDSAPNYDPLSERIVWHSLINDRYQIVSYDLKTGETVQLTDTSYNNMQPMAHGNKVFWQAWIEDNWEIVRLDGNEVIQMTDNKVHDISPYAQDNYVMWQTQNGDGWQTSLYDMSTNQHQFIDSDTDGVTKNPRLVLMYESYDANGDVRVFGYDLKKGEYINLASVPTSLPDELPTPAEEDEERALIQAKPTVKENEEGVGGGNVNNDTQNPTLDLGNDTSTSDGSNDIVVPPLTQETIATSTEVSELDVVDVSASTTRDKAEAEVDRLVEEKLAEQSVAHIEDVVIPPVATSSDEVVG